MILKHEHLNLSPYENNWPSYIESDFVHKCRDFSLLHQLQIITYMFLDLTINE